MEKRERRGGPGCLNRFSASIRVQKGMNRLKRYKLVAMDPSTRHYKPTKKGEDVAPTIRGEATRTISTTPRTVPASQ
jgi:hypothetical protein